MTQIKFVKEIPVINGTYKKDTPNKEIGYQKWRVRKTYEVDICIICCCLWKSFKK